MHSSSGVYASHARGITGQAYGVLHSWTRVAVGPAGNVVTIPSIPESKNALCAVDEPQVRW